MKKLIIFGDGQIADIMSYYFQEQSEYNVECFCIDDKFHKNKKHLGKPLISFSKLKKKYPPKNYFVHIALSYKNMNFNRKKKYKELKKMGYKFANFISPFSSIPNNIKIGDNVVILEGYSIQPYVKISNNVMIWSGSIIGHHSTIKDHAWITSGANIGGNATIGENSFVGLNATIGNMVKIGKNCFIGANALVTKNLSANQVCVNEDTKIFKLKTPDFIRLTKFR